MSSYIRQEFDFVERTLAIVNQYESLEFERAKLKGVDLKKKYETTLLLNCLVGLLILPQQTWFDALPTIIVSRKEWGIDATQIALIKCRGRGKRAGFVTEDKNVKNVARHIRNSVAHANFSVFANSQAKLSNIKLEDFADDKRKNPNAEKTFEVSIPLPYFRKFVTKFANEMLSQMKANR